MVKIREKTKFILVLRLFFNIVFLLLMTTCSSPSTLTNHSFPISNEERMWIKEFFREFLFWNPCDFTLYGSKPVSLVCLLPPCIVTDEEREEAKKKHPEAIEFASHMYENYHKWKAIEDRFCIRKYLFGIFPNKD